MFRKKRRPTPGFGIPPPYNSLAGTHATVGIDVDMTRVAVFKVVSIQDDYLTCNGWLPEEKVFIDSIAVAKPHALQKTLWDTKTVTFPDYDREYAYTDDNTRTVTIDPGGANEREVVETLSTPYYVGELIVAAKARTKCGDTPGTPVETPATADNILEIAYKTDGTTAIAWTDLNVAGRAWSGDNVRIARVILLNDWHSCGIATANTVDWSAVPDEAGELTENAAATVTCRDPAGCIEWNLAAMQDDAGSWYIPAGWYCTVWQSEDATDGHWELLAIGHPCEESSGSEGSGSSGSGSSGSGSEAECVTPEAKRLDGIPGYDATKKQALIHDHGCLEWMDIESCP